MITLAKVEDFIVEHWKELIEENTNKIKIESIFTAMGITDEADRRTILNNIDFFPFVNRISHNEIEILPDVLEGEDTSITRSPSDLLKLDIPFIEVIPKPNAKNSIYILESESAGCGNCTQYSEKKEMCRFRNIPRPPYYPICMYYFKKNRRRWQ